MVEVYFEKKTQKTNSNKTTIQNSDLLMLLLYIYIFFFILNYSGHLFKTILISKLRISGVFYNEFIYFLRFNILLLTFTAVK